MKPRASLFALSFSAGLMALSLTGCSSFPGGKTAGPDATKPVGGKAIHILQLRDNVKATRVALNRTIDALNRIPSSPGLQDAYAAFSTELSAFQKLAETSLRDSAGVRNSGKVLFAQWEQETATIKNPDIRAIAEKRRGALEANYNAMITPLLAARADLTEIRNDLADIQKALSLDPTSAGVAAIKKPIEQINLKASASVHSLDALAANLDKIAADLPAPAVAPVK